MQRRRQLAKGSAFGRDGEAASEGAELTFAVDGLAAELEKAPHRRLRGGVAERGVEARALSTQRLGEVAVMPENARLRRGNGVRRERGDATREALDERSDLIGRERPVDPSVALRFDGIEVVAPEDHLERATATDQPWKSLRAAATGDDPERHLGLIEHRPSNRCEPHVAAQRQLASSPTDASFDLCDRGLGHGAEGLAHRVECRRCRGFRKIRRNLKDQRNIEVSNEEVWVRALQHHHSRGVVVAQLLRHPTHVAIEHQIEKVDRPVVDRDPSDSVLNIDAKRGVVGGRVHGARLATARRQPGGSVHRYENRSVARRHDSAVRVAPVLNGPETHLVQLAHLAHHAHLAHRAPHAHLAQLNIAKLVAPLDDPRLADFANNLDRINALAESSDGFVWRLKGEGNDATSLRVFPDPSVIVNMSVWHDVEALRAFTYASDHTAFLRRRREFFVPMHSAAVVLWRVPIGHQPTLGECRARLEHLDRYGTDAYAFLFRDKPRTLTMDRCALDDPVATSLLAELDADTVGRFPADATHHLASAGDDVEPGNGGFFVVHVDGRAAGCGAVRRHGDGAAELHSLFVRPEFRGMRLDAALVSNLCGVARDLCIGRVLVETITDQPEAQQTFVHAGFERITNFGPNRDSPHTICFAKNLDTPSLH